jgi:hypothetical protein
MSDNPYAPPKGQPLNDTPTNEDQKSLRAANISHEVAVQLIGTLYFGVCVTHLALALIFLSSDSFFVGRPEILFLIFVGGFSAVLSFGIMKLRAWARYLAIVCSAVGLFAVPIGTLISGYILYLFFKPASSLIFSSRYREVIAETPDLNDYHKSVPRFVWGILAVPLVLNTGIAAAYIFFLS